MAKSYIDSNVFFYAKIDDKVFGPPCSSIIHRIAAGKLEAASSALVLVEVANALRKYGLGDEVAREVHAICSLIADIYAIDVTDVQEAAQIYGEAKVSPYDCLHAAVMRRNGVSAIISADRDFDKIRFLRRVDPRSTIQIDR